MMDAIQRETLLLEAKWKLVNIEDYYRLFPDATVNWYKMKCMVYLYFTGHLQEVDFDFSKRFIRALYKAYPYAKVLLHSDRVFYDCDTDYIEVTAKMRWQLISRKLCLYDMRLLYDIWEYSPSLTQLTIGL